MKKKDIYIQGMKDGLSPFSSEMSKNSQHIEQLGERVDNVIDLIELNNQHKNPQEILDFIKRKKLRQLKISIIYSSQNDKKLAEALRKDFNNQKHSCGSIDYQDFKKRGGDVVDYRIFIGNPEGVSENLCKTLYEAYGMKILLHNHQYIVVYDSDYNFSEENRDEFITYYESIITQSLKQSKEAEKALKKRKDWKQKLSEPWFFEKKINSIEDDLNKAGNFWEDTPEWTQIIFGIPHLLLIAVGGLLSIPAGIGEALLLYTIDNLQEKDFDHKFVADAQRQILEVKLLDLFKNEQLKDIV